MRLIKYFSLMSKLSKIEGQKESLNGQLNLSAKLLNRGQLSEELFLERSNAYDQELRRLASEKRTALRHYIAA